MTSFYLGRQRGEGSPIERKHFAHAFFGLAWLLPLPTGINTWTRNWVLVPYFSTSQKPLILFPTWASYRPYLEVVMLALCIPGLLITYRSHSACRPQRSFWTGQQSIVWCPSRVNFRTIIILHLHWSAVFYPSVFLVQTPTLCGWYFTIQTNWPQHFFWCSRPPNWHRLNCS